MNPLVNSGILIKLREKALEDNPELEEELDYITFLTNGNLFLNFLML